MVIGRRGLDRGRDIWSRYTMEIGTGHSILVLINIDTEFDDGKN